MTKHGKRYRDAARRFDPQALHGPAEALELVRSLASTKFDETVELAVQLGVDPRKADQQVRGTVSLPAGTGGAVRVAVFATGDAAGEARAAGADHVGGDDLVAQVEGGMLDFDVAIATPDLMAKVARLGRTLGPRGLMPNPKTGTVTFDVATAVRETKAGKVEYRVDKTGVIHVGIGKVSFESDRLRENAQTLLDAVVKAKPSTAKGKYVKKVNLASTMSPGVLLDETVYAR
jgi:large subunit ribosomal protein L1